MEQISELFKLSPRRIGQILYKNIDFLKSNKEWEKTKRIVHLKRLLKNHPETLGKKGTLDIIEQLKDETEGSKNNDKGVNVTVVMNNVAIEGKPLEYRLGDLITS